MSAKALTTLGLVALFTVGAGAEVYKAYGTDDTVEFTVQNKDRVTKGKDSKYLIWTIKKNGEKEVFEDTDTLLRGKFNSSDVYGDLETGKTYKANVNGWRLPALSSYRNILNVAPSQ